MCRSHKAKEYADVFCSVVINIQCNEFNSPPEESKQYTATVWSNTNVQLHGMPHCYFSARRQYLMLSTNSYISLSLRMDGGGAAEEFECQLEVKNQKIRKLEVSNPYTQ